tara:strand:+ start:699 stop:1364 length:666 start_codon:yes stop_codon:yes gene_type:complete
MDYFHWTQPLLDIIPEESTKGKLLRESIASYDQENKTYTARKEFQKELERKKQTCPTLALQLLMKLQIAVDNLEDGHLNIESEDLDQVKNLIFNVDEENNLMNVITDLIGLVNESQVKEPKKRITKGRISRANILAKARDPDNKFWIFCDKCNRPMMKSSLAAHQESSVCIEIKSGLKKTIAITNASGQTAGQVRGRRDVIQFIADQTCGDDSDGEGGISR